MVLETPSFLEGISLPAEKIVWQATHDRLKETRLLEKDEIRFLLIGTDSRLSLAREILASLGKKAKITVIQKDPKVLEQAEQNLPEGITTNDLISGEFPQDLPSSGEYDVIVAKHLLNFLSEGQLEAVINGA